MSIIKYVDLMLSPYYNASKKFLSRAGSRFQNAANEAWACSQKSAQGMAPPQNFLAPAQTIVDHCFFMRSLCMRGLCPLAELLPRLVDSG